MIKCNRCGKANASGTAFCQFCGTPCSAQGLPGAAHAAAAEAAGARCPTCGTGNTPGTNFCQGCGARLRDGARPEPVTRAASRPTAAVFGAGPIPGSTAAAPSDGEVLPPPSLPAARPRGPGPDGAAHSRLVAIRRDGSDGTAYPLRGEQIDIGRTEGDLLFDDPHLGPRHARITARGGDFVLAPLEPRNGVYVRVRSPTEIADGDHLLIGKQVLRFELIPDAEKNLRPALEHGVVLFGTPVKPPWGRLRQLTSGGTTRDVYHLCRNDVVAGREQGDIVFSDDEFLSRRHAQLSFRGGRVRLEDLGSSNGTFLRLRGQHTLTNGEMLRMGDELLRFEIG